MAKHTIGERNRSGVMAQAARFGLPLLMCLFALCLAHPQALSGARSKGAVRAAYNSQEGRYLLVWTDARNSSLGTIGCYEEPGCNQDIYGSVLSAELYHGPEIPISIELGEQHYPDVAYNSRRNEYLVVYHLRRVDFDVFAARVSAEGEVLETIAVCTEIYDQWEPAVTYDAINDRYLVAWMGYFHGGVGKDVMVQLFSGDGSKIGASHIVSLDDAGVYARGKQERPSVAFSPEEQKYIVVWDDEGRQGGSGTVLDRDGNIAITPDNFFFTQGPSQVLYPQISYSASERQALVVWQEAHNDGSKTVVARKLDLQGNRLGDPLTVARYFSALDPRPGVGCDDENGSCLIGWMDTVYGIGRLQFVDRYGNKTGQEMGGVSGARPSITFNSDQRYYLVVSGDNPSILKRIEALPSPPAGTPTPTAPSGSRVTVIIQKGALGDSEDTHIYQYEPDRNYGRDSALKVGGRQRNAALLRFELSSVPAHAAVIEASLQLYAKGWGGTDTTLDLYRLLRPVGMYQATWNQARSGEPWSVPGCNGIGTDRSGQPESTVQTASIGKWYSFGVTELLQRWVDGSLANHGLVVRQAVPWSTAEFFFSSSDDSTVHLRPKLVVTYRASDGPTATPTNTPAQTSTARPSQTPTASRTQGPTPTPSHTPTTGPSPTTTATPTRTATATRTLTPTVTLTPTAVPPGREVSVTLQQGNGGYAGASDTHIYQYDPSRNYCRESALEVGYKQRHAAVLRFELSDIPADAQVLRATLQLYAQGWGGTDTTFNLHRVLRAVDACSATWNQAQSGLPWELPGCNGTASDRSMLPESTVNTDGIRQWYGFDLTSLAQEWVAGRLPNYGVVMREASPWMTGKFFFSSSEDSTVPLRPKLVVTYRVSDEPTATASPTSLPTATATSTAWTTPSSTAEPAPTASGTPASTLSATPTESPTGTPTSTPIATLSETATLTPSPLPTGSVVTAVLQQGTDGYEGCEDTYFYQYAPEQNHCDADALMVGYRQRYGTLLWFDLSSLPMNADVSQASLQLFAKGWGGSDTTLAAYGLLRPFAACQATWNQARLFAPWGQPGCNDTSTDRRAVPESSVDTDTISKWYRFDLTELVQAWLNGSQSNNGVLLRGALPYSAGLFYFASAQHPDIDMRPKLVIQYRAPQGPDGTPTPTPQWSATPTPTPSPTPPRGGEITVSLQQGINGYIGCEDTFIYQYAPNTNYCQQGSLEVGYKQRSAAMLRFDLDSIPARSSVVKAHLQLYAAGWGGTDMTVDVHRVLRPVRLCEATWNHARGVVSWGVPGCNDPSTDRSAMPESSVTTHSIAKWYHFDLKTLVQAWVDGTLPNEGVIVRGASVWSTGQFFFNSAESDAAELRPKLVITYR